MRITITCEVCNHKNRLERPVMQSATLWCVCHGCEALLSAEFVMPATPTRQVKPAWYGWLVEKVS